MIRVATLLLAAGIAPLAAAGTTAAAAHEKTAPGAELLSGRRILVLGDSITQDGKWVGFLDYLLQKGHPSLRFDIISAGLSSETTSGLSEPGHAGGRFPRPCVHERLDRALKETKPALVIACYGMNDGIYKPHDPTRMKAFTDGMTGLVQKSVAAGAKVVLVTPPIYTGGARDYDDTLARFAEWEVKKPPAGVVATADLHTAMRAELNRRRAENPKFTFAGDGVHPDELGHLVMALAVLKDLGVKTPEGAPETLLAEAKRDPLFALASRRRSARAEGWLNHIGYTRETQVAPGSGDIAAVEREAARLQSGMDALRRASK